MAQEDINGAIGDTGGTPYPVQFSVAYPESSNRLTVLVRLILAVPIFVILGLIAGTSAGSDESAGWADVLVAFFIPVGGLPFATMLMILFRQKYPRWWFDWISWWWCVSWDQLWRLAVFASLGVEPLHCQTLCLPAAAP